MPITAAGSILPKNATRGGVFLLAGNRMKGRKRVNIVPATTAAMVMICSVKVII